MSPTEGSRKVLVIGNYRFTGRLLGRGNFARVEEAVHNILNVKVAIKIMNVSEIKEDYVIKNLYREAKLMAKLNHPCIAALYQTMQRSDNVYYLVTELAAGGDLCTFIKNQKHGKLNESTTRFYGRQFVSALAHMHNLGVVHRDLKMENVMLNPEQTQIKIVDFGLSNLYQHDDPLRTHCGSPEYAAPELFITGKKYGPEVDLWSFGIILYGMVVGQLPFISNRSEQISSQERRKKLVSQISRGLSSVHRRALALYSQDFRSMMNRMLVADTRKRIGIKELLVHPWITEKGRRVIKPNPVKKLETKDQTKIILDISEMMKLPIEEIVDLIKTEPFSKIGGIYNILVHMYSMNRLCGNGITRTVPSLNFESFTGKLVDSNKEMPYNLRISLTRLPPKCSDVKENNENTNKSKIIGKKPDISNQTKFRPKTVQPTINREQNIIDYRTIKSPTLRRKAYSASISPQVRPVTASLFINKLPKIAGATLQSDIPKQATKGKCLVNGLNVLRKISKGSKPEKEENTRAKSATDRKQRSKSDKLPNLARPATTTAAVLSLKRSLQTTNTKPVDRAVSRPAKVSTLQQGIPIEISPLAHGDNGVRNEGKKAQKQKKPVIYDPIARCIAGYVVNNIPKNLPF